MDGVRLLAFAGTIAAAMFGTLYAGAADGKPPGPIAVVSDATSPQPMPADAPRAFIPEGQDISHEVGALLDASRDEFLDPETGVRLGPLTILPSPEPVAVTPEPVSTANPRSQPSRRARPSRPRPEPTPRLHPDPGRHVILTARGMMARGERIQGSCYRYLSEVFERAGHDHWRTRRVVYHEGRAGPYGNLDLIRPGDWLYIVNHPERTPVGTHSVLFVGWQDRSRGYAHVIEHSGWGAPSAGRERTYDVSRTYRIIRPVLSR